MYDWHREKYFVEQFYGRHAQGNSDERINNHIGK